MLNFGYVVLFLFSKGEIVSKNDTKSEYLWFGIFLHPVKVTSEDLQGYPLETQALFLVIPGVMCSG